MNGFGGEALRVDPAAELVGSMFCFGEYDGQFTGGLVSEVLYEELAFVFAIDEADFLVDFLRGGDFGGDGDRLGVVKDSVSQFFDRGAQGGREKEGLTLSGKLGDDALDVAKESHVEHAVDFIENEVVDAGKIDISLVHVIEKTPGAGDENVDAGFHGVDLWVFANASIDEGLAEAQVFPVGVEALGDLGGEFPGGGENQNSGAFSLRPLWVLQQGIEDGQ